MTIDKFLRIFKVTKELSENVPCSYEMLLSVLYLIQCFLYFSLVALTVDTCDLFKTCWCQQYAILEI